MKKTVKVSDIRRMVKMFNLSEDEQFWLSDICYDINAEQDKSRYSTRLSFLMSPEWSLDSDRYNAIASILMYFGLKVQETIGQFFNETCNELGNVLNADPRWIARIFRGMSYSNSRWDSKVYVADRCGLNVLELSK